MEFRPAHLVIFDWNDGEAEVEETSPFTEKQTREFHPKTFFCNFLCFWRQSSFVEP